MFYSINSITNKKQNIQFDGSFPIQSSPKFCLRMAKVDLCSCRRFSSRSFFCLAALGWPKKIKISTTWWHDIWQARLWNIKNTKFEVSMFNVLGMVVSTKTGTTTTTTTRTWRHKVSQASSFCFCSCSFFLIASYTGTWHWALSYCQKDPKGVKFQQNRESSSFRLAAAFFSSSAFFRRCLASLHTAGPLGWFNALFVFKKKADRGNRPPLFSFYRLCDPASCSNSNTRGASNFSTGWHFTWKSMGQTWSNRSNLDKPQDSSKHVQPCLFSFPFWTSPLSLSTCLTQCNK